MANRSKYPILFYVFCLGNRSPQDHLKILPFPTDQQGPQGHRRPPDVTCGVCFWALISCSWPTGPAFLMAVASQEVQASGKASPCFLFFKFFLVIQQPLFFHTDFRISS